MFCLLRYYFYENVESGCCVTTNPLALPIRYVACQIVHFAVYFTLSGRTVMVRAEPTWSIDGAVGKKSGAVWCVFLRNDKYIEHFKMVNNTFTLKTCRTGIYLTDAICKVANSTVKFRVLYGRHTKRKLWRKLDFSHTTLKSFDRKFTLSHTNQA